MATVNGSSGDGFVQGTDDAGGCMIKTCDCAGNGMLPDTGDLPRSFEASADKTAATQAKGICLRANPFRSGVR